MPTRRRRASLPTLLPVPVPGGCYQIREFGPGLKVLVDLIRDLVAKYKLSV